MIEYRVIKFRKDGNYHVQIRDRIFFIFSSDWHTISTRTNKLGFPDIHNATLYAIRDKARMERIEEQKQCKAKYVPEIIELKI